ncbi:type IV pilin-like G/H family protein [Aerosakkonemataceae cyanobacterium BLCC-F154]|uniref:Type IV pilin-like G/H family protein n=1 Tax=Floridaenema fluviatile BLCC-F154 TaxID=3153640 RepID=A0ABV4Y854_9CYAN
MSIEMRVKWLLYVLNQNREKGFSFFPLILVMFILTIAAYFFILPELVTSPTSGVSRGATRGRQAEGKQYVSSINKAQQAYYTENATFVTQSNAEGWGSLAVGIKTQTTNYKYSISPIGTDGVNAFADASKINKKLKNYTGVVGLVQDPENRGKKISQAIVCETYKAGDVPMPGEVTETEVKCSPNSYLVVR